MLSDGLVVKPASGSSDSSAGSELAQATIFSAMGGSTMWTTNSPLLRILAAVSLGMPGERSPGARATMGGSEPKTLKNENGAALTVPFAETVVTRAIGRGVTTVVRSL